MQKFITLSLFLPLSTMAVAQDKIQESYLKESIVTGTGYEMKINELPKNAYVISKEDIKNSKSSSIIDLLKSVPSIYASAGYGAGVVDFRGQGTNAQDNVLILIDGVVQNSIDMSGIDFAAIDTNSIERIEIIPSGGVIYGDRAVGGVINIITNKKIDKIKVEAGSYGYTNFSANIAKEYNDLLIHTNFSLSNSDGYRENSDSDKKNFGIGTRYLINDLNSIKFDYSHNEAEVNYPGSLSESEVNNDRTHSNKLSSNNIDKDSFSLGYNFKTNNIELENNFNYTIKESDWSSNRDIDTDKLSNRLNIKYQFNKNTIISGIDMSKGTAETDYNNSITKVEKSQIGLFAHDTYSLNDSTSLSLGYRFEKMNLDLPTSNMEKSYDQGLFSIGANYFYSDTGSTYISFEQNYRTPNTGEYAYSSSPEDLEPQISDIIEGGFRDYIFNTAINLSVFTSNTEKELFYNPNSGNYGNNENYKDDITRNGVELSAVNYISDFTLTQSYTYLDAKFDGGQYDGNTVPWVPKSKYNLKVNYGIDNFSIFGEYSYNGNVYSISDYNNSYKTVDPYSLVNLGVSYNIHNINVYGGINNIFDKEYYEYVTYGSSYYPAKERNFYLGISYIF